MGDSKDLVLRRRVVEWHIEWSANNDKRACGAEMEPKKIPARKRSKISVLAFAQALFYYEVLLQNERTYGTTT